MNTTETKHTPDSIEFLVSENNHFRDLIDRSLTALQQVGNGNCVPQLRVKLSSALAHDPSPLHPVYASAPQLLAALQAIEVGTSPASVALQFSNVEALCSELHNIASAALAKIREGK